jgi:hypothetical protein
VAIEAKSGRGRRSAKQLAKDRRIATEGGIIIGKNAPRILKGKRIVLPTIEWRIP